MAKPNINVLNKLKGQSRKLKAKDVVVNKGKVSQDREITDEESKVILSNYSLDFEVETQTKTFLEDQTVKIHCLSTKMYNELGEIFSETQKKLSNNKTGVFEQWYTLLGFNKKSVYRLMNRWNYIVSNWHNKILIENLPISLSYEVSNPNCSEELSSKVLEGKIKTLKEFRAEKVMLEDEEPIPVLLEAFEYEDFSARYKTVSKVAKKRFSELTGSKKMKVEKLLEQLEKALG